MDLKKDFKLVTIIGLAVGILIQPMVSNLVANPTWTLRLGLLIGLTLFAPLALFIAYLLGKAIPVLYQFAKFAAVGTLNSFVDFGVLNLLIWGTGIASGLAYSGFKAISFLCGTTNSYLWNRSWTFSAKNQANAGEAVKFYTIAILGGIINVAIASFIVNQVGHPASISDKLWANIGALAGIFSTLIWNFIGYKFVVFKKAEPVLNGAASLDTNGK